MAANHLEQLIAEWYEYLGYFVRRNVKVGKRERGGYEGELDIVAFHPHPKRLVHIEASLDTDSWAKREERYVKKFEAGRKYIPTLFQGLDLPGDIEQIAILAYGSTATHTTLGGGQIIMLPDLLKQIFDSLRDLSILTNMIDEQKPLLRTVQLVAFYRRNLLGA
jgi:hypothetical protein